MLFGKARKLLIQKGWVPVRMHPTTQAPNAQTFPVTGAETRLLKKGIFEVDSCSMDAGSLCNFIYQHADTCMRVMTRGEIPADMRVVQWEPLQSCADAAGSQTE